MKIASYPPTKPRPSTHDAARHINEEARLVLASLRGGPPYVARGELALGLRELRGYVRGQFLDANNNNHANVVQQQLGSCGGGVGDYYYTSAVNAANSAIQTPRDETLQQQQQATENGEESGPLDATISATSPQIRIPPPPSPNRDVEDQTIDTIDGRNEETQFKSSAAFPPPPPIPVTNKTKDGIEDATQGQQERPESPTTQPASPVQLSPPTPHSVPPSSPDTHSSHPSNSLVPPPPLPLLAAQSSAPDALLPTTTSDNQPTYLQSPTQQQQQGGMNQNVSNHLSQSTRFLQAQQSTLVDPGPYATPFLAVIVDPRAAGPHTLVALRSLYRLLERGSIVQLTRCSTGGENNAAGNNHESGNKNSDKEYVHETTLEPIARGVLACRFEQTDAGADEAVEMAIADLLRLLVELDAAGARSAESALLRQVYLNKKERAERIQQQQQQKDASSQQVNSARNAKPKSSSSSAATGGGTMIKVQRLPSSILMEAFHAVFITRHTFVRDGGGHHSPALSFHFEQVLMKMIHCIFGGEDAQSTLKNNKSWKNNSVMSSRHLGGATKVMQFLVDSLLLRKRNNHNDDRMGMAISDDGRTLCLRLVQCCLRTGWGNNDTSNASDGSKDSMTAASPTSDYEDPVLIRLVEDNLCLALLTTGQAIWAHHDEMPSFSGTSSSSSASNSSAGMTSLELLSEVCATLSLLWSLPKLRRRLRSQFESVFSGFYQRALSLLRKRPLPEDGMVYQANMIFDMEVEIILESLVDVLCLSSTDNSGCGCKSLSTIEELFLTYDCSLTESDVASGIIVELSRCCGGIVDEEGEPSVHSMPPSKAGTNGPPTPKSTESGSASPMLIARHRSVPDHLKELCFEALLGSLKRLFHGVESLSSVEDGPTETASQLRTAKNTKRSLHHAARLFNEKPKKGLQYLVDNGILSNPPDAKSVASFLRNGLVVGLDKAAVGQYLGELGKSAKDTKADTPVWEQDWFHKELLVAFCSSFEFKHQTVLDGLRMFLATFRLPGEAQMIDRILQAFSESIARECQESVNGSLKLFSPDEKRASDAAYLLSFSIIMLNTDLHNDNIRADRKMKLTDFIRNNKNYGKEISDKDLPPEYLEGIYNAIKEEQIRTLGEGADGSMTVERWKDVMRSASSFQSHDDVSRDSKDLKELLLESSWQPILSAVSGLWGMVPLGVYQTDVVAVPDQNGTMLGARLGIDLAYEMLAGSGNCRPDIFQDLFTNICYMSGLLGEYNTTTEERADNFINSIEHQSAFTVAINIAEEHGDLIGLDGWKCVWAMLFELRDLQLLSARRRPNIMKESDPDLLSPDARMSFCRRMANWDELDEVDQPRRGGLMSFVFGSTSSGSLERNTPVKNTGNARTTFHGKEDLLIWDDLASSDDEDDHSSTDTEYMSFPSVRSLKVASIGATFENQLVHEEATLDSGEIGVTGLERIDVSHSNSRSLRVRVRQRLSQLVDFYGLIAESRYLSEEGLSDELNSLVEIIRDSSKKTTSSQGCDNNEALAGFPLSPASEAFAEILLCEIALKNRDRFALVWDTILRAHYNSRLTYRPSRRVSEEDDETQPETIKLTPGIEKCATGILRLSVWTSNRNNIANEVLPTLKILHPPCTLVWSPLELNLDKHLAEGLWRIVQNADGLSQINDEGWLAILGLAEWCAMRGGLRSDDHVVGSLAEDDPSLQAFRSLHLILHAVELKDSLPIDQWPQIVRSVRCLVEAGERGHCPKLSIAGLDLLGVLHTRMESMVSKGDESQHLLNCWRPLLEAIHEPAEKSRNSVSLS